MEKKKTFSLEGKLMKKLTPRQKRRAQAGHQTRKDATKTQTWGKLQWSALQDGGWGSSFSLVLMLTLPVVCLPLI